MKKQIIKASILMSVILAGVIVALRVFAADSAVTLAITPEDGWLMNFANDAYLEKWISTHTTLIKYTLAGIYGILRLIATLMPSNTSNRVIPMLMNLFGRGTK